MDDTVRKTTLKDIKKTKIGIEEFLEFYNSKRAILVDVRMPLETKIWGVSFAKKIPYNELPDRLDELPKDKLIVCACPNEYRSNMAKEYLRFKGFDVKNLEGGLLALMERLKGGKVKDIDLNV
jgi:rhodanese-related sulfurtransferase